MKKSVKRKFKRIFNLYNFAIVGCVVLIVVAFVILIMPENSSNVDKNGSENSVNVSDNNKKNSAGETNLNKIKIVETKNSGKEIAENDAKKLAQSQFKELGETKVKIEELEVVKIKREGEEYFYISSSNNTVEISKATGKITRINAVVVDQ